MNFSLALSSFLRLFFISYGLRELGIIISPSDAAITPVLVTLLIPAAALGISSVFPTPSSALDPTATARLERILFLLFLASPRAVVFLVIPSSSAVLNIESFVYLPAFLNSPVNLLQALPINPPSIIFPCASFVPNNLVLIVFPKLPDSNPKKLAIASYAFLIIPLSIISAIGSITFSLNQSPNSLN